MTDAATTAADRLLDRAGQADLQQLLDQAQAPGDGLEAVLIADLTRGLKEQIGECRAEPGLMALAAGLLGDGEPVVLPPDMLVGLEFDGHVALLFPGDELVAVAVQLGSRTDLLQLRKMHRALAQHIAAQDFDRLAEVSPAARWYWRLRPGNGELIELQALQTGPALARELEALRARPGIEPLLAAVARGRTPPEDSRSQLRAVLVDDGSRYCELRRVPFVPRLVVGVAAVVAQPGHRVWATVGQIAEDVLRDITGQVLGAGMQTQIEPFPQTDREFDQIVAELRRLDSGDLDQRLILGGFANHPIDGADGTMRCRECIYYLPHRRWCDLPELPLPVEAEWYCRLWKL